ncbi:MAG TPA: hypothetical protein VF819_08980, partial [Nitrospira sp.]
MIASAAIGVIWAITGRAPSLAVTLIYSFLLGNSTALVLENVKIPASWLRPPRWWMFYLAVLLGATAATVTLATAVVFVVVPPVWLPPAPRVSFAEFLLTAWKFPTIANLIFGMGYLLYKANRDWLQDRNRQLERTVELKTAERELDAEELKQAREIQQGLLPKDLPQLSEFEIAGAWEP